MRFYLNNKESSHIYEFKGETLMNHGVLRKGQESFSRTGYSSY